MTSTHKDILVTGSSGFIGSNLTLALKEKGYNVLTFNRNESLDALRKNISPTTTIIHLAGENRPDDTSLFKKK